MQKSLAGEHLAERLQRARLALLRHELLTATAKTRLRRRGDPRPPSRKALAYEIEQLRAALQKYA